MAADGVRPPNPTGKLIPASQRQPEWSTLRFVDCSHNFADQLDESFQYALFFFLDIGHSS